MKQFILKWLTAGKISINKPKHRYYVTSFMGVDYEVSKFQYYFGKWLFTGMFVFIAISMSLVLFAVARSIIRGY